MDRFTEETYCTSTPRHFRSEEDYLDWIANHQPEPEEEEQTEELEPVEAQILSACCAAESKTIILESSTCPETGYREEGGLVDVCAACGGEFEPMLQPVFTARVAERKPVTRQQGELFNQGVA